MGGGAPPSPIGRKALSHPFLSPGFQPPPSAEEPKQNAGLLNRLESWRRQQDHTFRSHIRASSETHYFSAEF